MSEPLLKVTDLSMYYKTKTETVRAVEDVSFSIGVGQTFGLVGESGCGKSTTARSIIRLLPKPGQIVAGQVLYQGRDVAKMSQRELRDIRGKEIGMIFQDPMTSLNPVTTVGKQLYESLEGQGLDKQGMHERAVELLRMVNIPEPEERLGNYVHELSGGMRRRVSLARALAYDSDVLVLDEPLRELDAATAAAVLRLIDQSVGDRLLLLVTHDRRQAEALGCHVIDLPV